MKDTTEAILNEYCKKFGLCEEGSRGCECKKERKFLKTSLERVREEGQMNPKVGFLRQYLNENCLGKDEKMWTDDLLLGFLRIPFTNHKS